MEDNSISSSHHPINRILDVLPFEIVVKIFSCLRQRDCLASMGVCRQWFTMVPQYSRDVWKELYISPNFLYEDNTCWEQCVGVHVESIKFDCFSDEQELYDAMQKLIDCGCHQVQALEFEQCSTSSHDTFLPLLKQLLAAHSTIELTFLKHSPYLAYLHVLDAFPKLSRFSYTRAKSEQPVIYANIPPVNLPNTALIHLTHLAISTEIGMASILEQSPNLKYLAYGNANQNGSFPISPKQLFSWCPKLEYLELNSDHLAAYRSTSPIQRKQTNGSGLHSLTIHHSGYSGPDQVGPYLWQNSDSLEYIRIVESQGRSGNWSAIFRSVEFPKLRKLVCQNIVYQGAMDTMLTRCPAIEELVIVGDDETLHLPSALRCLPRLKRLDLNGVILFYDDELPDVETTVKDADALTRLFEKMAENGSKIEEIRMKNVFRLTDQLLTAMPRLGTLKVLEIDLQRGNYNYTDEALCRFVELLSQTQVKSLTLLGMRDPPVAMIHALTKLASLELLSLYGHRFCISIDANLLIHLLHSCKKLKSFAIIALELTGTKEHPVTYLAREVQGYKIINAVNLNSQSVIISFNKQT